jgi:hypothetical protein
LSPAVHWTRPANLLKAFVSTIQCPLASRKAKQTATPRHPTNEARARQIEATDQEVDRLVYELYGLTDDEIRIVEEATAR